MKENATTKALDGAIAKLAEYISATEQLELDESGVMIDHLDWLEVLRGLLPELIFQPLCDMLEVCPTHICDCRICIDDKATDCTMYADWIDLQNQISAQVMNATPENEHSGLISSERDAPGWRN